MNINNRQKDLTRVFDERWKANINNIDDVRVKEKDFMDKMFKDNRPNLGTNSNINTKINTSPEARLQGLQSDMQGASNFQKQKQINNIVKKWK